MPAFVVGVRGVFRAMGSLVSMRQNPPEAVDGKDACSAWKRVFTGSVCLMSGHLCVSESYKESH